MSRIIWRLRALNPVDQLIKKYFTKSLFKLRWILAPCLIRDVTQHKTQEILMPGKSILKIDLLIIHDRQFPPVKLFPQDIIEGILAKSD